MAISTCLLWGKNYKSDLMIQKSLIVTLSEILFSNYENTVCLDA
jgi:hypothetical protein